MLYVQGHGRAVDGRRCCLPRSYWSNRALPDYCNTAVVPLLCCDTAAAAVVHGTYRYSTTAVDYGTINSVVSVHPVEILNEYQVLLPAGTRITPAVHQYTTINLSVDCVRKCKEPPVFL